MTFAWQVCDGGYTVDVVIPARNESATITGAVATVAQAAGVGQIIVVDDGSTDSTAALARAAGATVIAGPAAGKGEAMAAGLAAVTTPRVFFADADINLLGPAKVSRLIAAATTVTGQVVAIRKDAALSRWPPISGERIVPTAVAAAARLTGWQAELQLDAACAAADLSSLHIATRHLHRPGRVTASEIAQLAYAAIRYAPGLLRYPRTVTLIAGGGSVSHPGS